MNRLAAGSFPGGAKLNDGGLEEISLITAGRLLEDLRHPLADLLVRGLVT